MRRRSGWPSNRIPNRSKASRSNQLAALQTVNNRRYDGRIVRAGIYAQSQSQIIADRKQVIDHGETLRIILRSASGMMTSRSTPRLKPLSVAPACPTRFAVAQIVNAANIDQHFESKLGSSRSACAHPQLSLARLIAQLAAVDVDRSSRSPKRAAILAASA